MSVFDDKTLIKRQYMEGVDLFKAGEEAHEAYLIEEGEVEIFKEIEGVRHQVATMRDNDIFGEMALLQGGTRTASAVATKRTTVVIITEKAIKEKLQDTDPLIATLIHILTKRLYVSNAERFGDKKNEIT